ncbi:MAG: methyltransferase domain-containing protein [bacterium]|nr:methyltransferase domain-containing protein [bacterium]
MELLSKNFLNILQCPACKKGGLSLRENQLVCSACRESFPVLNEKLCFTKDADTVMQKYDTEAKQFVNRLKSLVKKSPGLFMFLTYAIGSVSYFGQRPGRTIEKAFGTESKNKIIVNVGSGITKLHPDVTNLDIFPFKNVDIVADASSLPFKDASVDMLISESTIEHTPNAESAIREMCRVVKPGGFVYISIPFIMPFHASPNDYSRLTHEGLKQKFSDFTPRKVGSLGGPASALVTFLMYFLALPFSLISESAYNLATYLFMATLSPLRIFDLVFNLFPRAIEVSAFIYFIGEKKE